MNKRSITNERRSFQTNLSRLVENEMEKAEVVLNAKGILDDIQAAAEKLARIEAFDLMPMMDSLRASYGKTTADSFNNAVTQSLRDTIEALRASKEAIGTEISKLENVMNGELANDMAMDDGMDDEDMDDEDMDDEDMDMDMDMDDDEDNMDMDMDIDDDVPSPAVGRARKENYANKRKKIAEQKMREAVKNRRIMETYRSKIKEGRSPISSARFAAKRHSVNLSRVVEMVRQK